MNEKKQKLLIECILASPDTYALVQTILKPSYFDVDLRNSVTFVLQYYEDYNSLPSVDQIDAETDVQFTKRDELHLDEIEYVSHEVEQFCKEKAMESAIVKSAGLLGDGNYTKIEELIKEAILVGIDSDAGLDYFSDIDGRLQRRLKKTNKISTGWDSVDDLLFGGLTRKEMILFSANSGGGKSITMANLALNLLEQGLIVLYISLELSEDIVASRFDSMITDIGQRDWEDHVDEIGGKLKQYGESNNGELFIKYMNSGSCSNDIRVYLKEFQLKHNMIPDAVVVDYLDIMGSNESISGDNVFEKDKASAEQLRNIAADYNMIVITASQQNRSAVDATQLNHSHIAGGLSKINTTDVYISIILSDVNKASGEIGFQFLKTRNSDGVGSTTFLKWHSTTLRITDNKSNQDSGFKLSNNKQKQRAIEPPANSDDIDAELNGYDDLDEFFS